MKEVTKKAIYRRLEAVALLAEGKSPKEISQITKHNEKHVRQLGNRYHKEGWDCAILFALFPRYPFEASLVENEFMV